MGAIEGPWPCTECGLNQADLGGMCSFCEVIEHESGNACMSDFDVCKGPCCAGVESCPVGAAVAVRVRG